MKPSEKIERLMKKRRYRASPEVYDKALGSFLQAVNDHVKHKPAAIEPSLWRIIVKSRMMKLAAGAVIVVAGILVVDYFGGSLDGATPAWALDQTIEALDGTRTCVITGTATDATSSSFTCHIQFDDCMRYESDVEVYVVNGDTSYVYSPGYGEVLVRKGGDRKWYRKLMDMRLWASGSALKEVKRIADDWNETYAKDDQTGRDSVFVTCTAMERSVWFQVDVDSKLVVRGKLWRSPTMEGTPDYVAETIRYNVDIPAGTFDFETPPGVHLVSEEEYKARSELFAEAWALDKKKQYARAIELYQQIYERYPTWERAAWGVERIGDLHRWRLAQYDKALEYYKIVAREYPQLSYRLFRTYHSLGQCYMKLGEDGKALEAFQTCLELGRQSKQPEWFVFEDCKKKIAELKPRLSDKQ